MTDRDLLLEFVRYSGGDGTDSDHVDAFLASRVSTDWETTGKSEGAVGFYGASPVPVAPHVKVTEVDGQLQGEYTRGDWIERADGECETMTSLCPSEASSPFPERKTSTVRDGPLGHFRITVEFWPAAKP